MNTALEEPAEFVQSSGGDPLIVNGEAVIDRLPVLRSIFDQMAAEFSQSMQELTGAPVDFLVENVGAGRIGEVQNLFDAYQLAGVYLVEQLDSKVIVGVDRAFVIALVETLFGSNVADAFPDDQRTISRVECRAARYALDLLTNGLRGSLSSIVATTFELERFDDDLDLSGIGRKNAIAVTCRCKLRAFRRAGEALVVIPRSAFDPYRAALAREPKSEGSTPSEHWTKKLHDSLVQTEVKVLATMEKRGLTLDDIARFEVGTIIQLPISPTDLLKLECERQTLFWCELGQKDGFYTVRIVEFVDMNQEFIRELLGQ